MIAIWQFYWPVAAAALVIGVVTGLIAFRSAAGRPRFGGATTLTAGLATAIAAALLWHGPVGTGAKMGAAMERVARVELDRLEMNRVDARLARDPLGRELFLRGPADDFQRSELVRIMDEVPGVRSVGWADSQSAGEARRLPLFAEASLLGIAFFGLGLLLSYLLELRRRAVREWSW